MPHCLLTDRACLDISGDDARNFLHNLITCALPDASAPLRFGALLTPQGKILFEFFVVHTESGFLLDCAGEQAEDLMKRLTFYRLRAAVTIERVETQVAAMWGERPATTSWHVDPRSEAMGSRRYSDGSSNAMDGAVPLSDYGAHRIANGIPEILTDYGSSDVFPHEALMDQFTGVDFQKGCYVGQEVVSRMQHRGTARSRFMMVEASEPLPELDTNVMAGERSVGKMGGSVGHMGLAIVRLDRAKSALDQGLPIMAGKVSLNLRKPAFADFPWLP